MEFKITAIPKIEPIQFNYLELKQELTERTEQYKTVAYTADTIKEAKADRAKLNALKKSMNDERIRLEREYNEPFQQFKSQVAELCGIVDEAVKAVDAQVKDYEDLKKQEKRDGTMILVNEFVHSRYPWVPVECIWNEKWLNTTYSVKQIRTDLETWAQKITGDMEILGRLPEYAFEAQETYKRSLNINDALSVADNLKRMEEAKHQKEEAEAREQQGMTATQPQEDAELSGQNSVEEFMPKPETPDVGTPEPQKQVLRFQCYCTMEQAMALRQFMVNNGIKFERC